MHVSGLTEIQRCEGTGTMILLTPTVDLQLCFLNRAYADVSLLNQCGQFLILLTPSPHPTLHRASSYTKWASVLVNGPANIPH